MVSSTTCSCSTSLCLRLCSRQPGALSEDGREIDSRALRAMDAAGADAADQVRDGQRAFLLDGEAGGAAPSSRSTWW